MMKNIELRGFVLFVLFCFSLFNIPSKHEEKKILPISLLTSQHLCGRIQNPGAEKAARPSGWVVWGKLC